jgi:hypothetical protein
MTAPFPFMPNYYVTSCREDKGDNKIHSRTANTPYGSDIDVAK